MKKLIIISAALAIQLYAAGQKTRIGLQAGLNYSGISGNTRESAHVNYVPGISAGILFTFPISKNYSVLAGINFTQKGMNETGSTYDGYSCIGDDCYYNNYDYKKRIRLNYLELPFNFIYKSSGGFFGGGGPVLSYALSGRYRYESIYENGETITEDRKITFENLINILGSDGGEVMPGEIGFNIIAGKEFKNGILISVNFNYGISHSIGTTSNQYFGLRLGYLLSD